MYQDPVQLPHNVLQIMVKQEIIDKCTSGQSLSKIDLDSDEVFKKDFYLGFAAESEIKDLKKKDSVKNTEIQNIQKNVCSCVVSTLKKMFERSPLGSVVIRNATVFNPTSMQITKDSTLHKKLRELFQHFVSLKLLFAPTADNAFTEYVAFLKEVKKVSAEDVDNIDDFFFKKCNVSKFPELSSVLNIVLTMNHGQTDVDRGFSL